MLCICINIDRLLKNLVFNSLVYIGTWDTVDFGNSNSDRGLDLQFSAVTAVIVSMIKSKLSFSIQEKGPAPTIVRATSAQNSTVKYFWGCSIVNLWDTTKYQSILLILSVLKNKFLVRFLCRPYKMADSVCSIIQIIGTLPWGDPQVNLPVTGECTGKPICTGNMTRYKSIYIENPTSVFLKNICCIA